MRQNFINETHQHITEGFGQEICEDAFPRGGILLACDNRDLKAMQTYSDSTTTAIVFLIWEHRANSNLRPLGAPRPEYSSRWAVGCWFVPILNLGVPFQIVRYIWRKSDPDTVNGGERFGSWNYSGADEFTVKAWWGFWIATNIVGRFSDRISWRANELSERTLASWSTIFASLLSAIAALLAISVLRGINARQDERYRRLMFMSQQQSLAAGVAPPNFA